MRLVLGGFAQGKLTYVLWNYPLQEDMVFDGILPDDAKLQKSPVIINHLHFWIRRRILDGGCPEEEIWSFLEHYPNCILICDEIGNGIVPMEPFERAYRERVGRMLIQLAEKAEEVERVICGIGQKIK